MYTISKIIQLANYKLQNRTCKDLYNKFSTELKIKSIESGSINDVIIRVTTDSKIINDGFLFEDATNWVEVYFKVDYDLTNEEQKYLLCEYEDFKDISIIDFLKIKTTNRKMYKFFDIDAQVGLELYQRKMDMNNIDDIRKIRNYFSKKIREYQYIVDYYDEIQCEETKNIYEINKEFLSKYDNMLKEKQHKIEI